MSKKLRYILLPLLIMALLLTAVSFAAAEKGSEKAVAEKASKLKITTQPKNQDNILVGKTAKFTVKATGSKLKYQWYYKEEGASEFTLWKKMTKATLSFKAAKNQNNMKVYCEVSDSTGKKVKSKTATLTVFQITEEPEHERQAYMDTKVNFTVGATGKGLKYQWYRKKSGESKFTPVAKATKKTLTFLPTADMDKAQFYCVVTNSNKKTLKTKTVEMLFVSFIDEGGLHYELTALHDGLDLWGFTEGKDFAEVNVPATVRGFPVYGIQGGTFKNNKTITKLKTPDTNLWVIWFNAFEDCPNLKEVKFGLAMNSIHDRAFSGCTQAKFELTDYIDLIGYDAFNGVTDYLKVNAGTRTFTAIMKTLQHCEVNYGSYSMWIDNGTIKRAAINTVCPTEVTLPEGVDLMEDHLFEGWNELQVVNYQPEDDFYNVSAWAFKDCKALTTVNLSRFVNGIGMSAFEGCWLLKNIVLPEGLNDIGSYAFKGCADLQTLTIPKGTHTFGEGCFDGTPVTLRIYRNSPADEWVKTTTYNYEYVD